jgi:hypothetical protein
MKFTVSRSSGPFSKSDDVEIETIADLLAFVEKCGNSVIISKPDDYGDTEAVTLWELEIYDDYRE